MTSPNDFKSSIHSTQPLHVQDQSDSEDLHRYVTDDMPRAAKMSAAGPSTEGAILVRT